MKKTLIKSPVIAAVVFGAFATIPAVAISAPAMAREAFVFSFNAGDVGLAYRNGY